MRPLEVVLTSVVTAIVVVVAAFALQKSIFSDDAPLVEPIATIETPPPATLEKAGVINVDSPEIYTRERLVNDRYQQDAWLRRRLELTDELEFGIQGVRDVRAATSAIAQAKLGVALNPLGDTTVAKPTPTLPELQREDGEPTPVEPSADEAGAQQPKAAEDRSPIDDFRDRVAYREEVRSSIIENQLDDRHDLDGNTLYRLKFDATVIPTHNNGYWGKVEVRVKPKVKRLVVPHYSKSWSMEARAAHLQNQWFKNQSDEVALWQQIYIKYLEGLSQTVSSQFANRVAALRRIIEFEESSEDMAVQTKQDLRELLFSIDGVVEAEITSLSYSDPYAPEGASADLKKRCKRRSASGSLSVLTSSLINRDAIAYASCMVQGTADHLRRDRTTDFMGPDLFSGVWSRAQMVDRVIARALWRNFDRSTSQNRSGSASRNSKDLTPVVSLSLSDELQSLVRVDPTENWQNLFDIIEIDETELSRSMDFDSPDYNPLICRDSEPEIFKGIDEKLKRIGLSLEDPSLVNSPIVRLNSFQIETDPDSGLLRCFDTWLGLVRSDGFITFLQRFMDESGQTAYSYAITPKEAVQRLSDTFDRAQASSALAAIGLAAAAVDAEASVAALKQIENDFSGISRYPLVVGYSQAEQQSDPAALDSELIFGWVIAPRFHPGQDGAAPSFRQVLTQQVLSALISVPAWWPALDLTVTTSWMDMESGTSAESQSQQYPDVRLPGDFHEIQRILSPVLDKAPKIDRDSMEETVFRANAAAANGGAATDQSIRVVIPGQNLWRSTVVTLGAERAREIWVMPNMGGIVAQFDRTPALHDGKIRYLPLRIWTSEGMDIVRNKICVVPHDDTSGRICRTGGSRENGGDPLGATEVAAGDPRTEGQQVALRADDPSALGGEAAIGEEPGTGRSVPDAGRTDGYPSADGGMDPEGVVAQGLVQALGQQGEVVRQSLAEVVQGSSTGFAAAKQSIAQLRQIAQELASLEQSNQTVRQVVETAMAVEQAWQSGIDEEAEPGEGMAGEELERQVSELTAHLQVLELETQRTALDRSVSYVFLDADSGVGSAAIQQAGSVPFKLKISGLTELTGRDLELRVGLVPESLSEKSSLASLVPIEDWESSLEDGVLEIAIDVPVFDSIGNGMLARVVLQVWDRALGYSSETHSRPFVFYVDAARASIRAVGTDIRLRQDTLEGVFSLTLPARLSDAFPDVDDGTIIVAAQVMNEDGEPVELRPEIFPLSDFDEEDMLLDQELILSMLLDLAGTDQKLLQNHFDNHGPIAVDLAFELDRQGELPKFDNRLSITGFAEPPPVK